MCIGQGMILLDNTIVNVALPAIQRGLRVTPGNLEWTINAYVLALASLIVLGGTLGDRYGRRRLYLVGLAGFTVCSAACGLASDDLEADRVPRAPGRRRRRARAAQPLDPRRRVPGRGRAGRHRHLGERGAGLGFVAGPIVGGILITQFDWPAVFWVNVPLGILGIVLTLIYVRESRDPSERPLDPVGNVLVAAGLFVLTFALIETNVHPWRVRVHALARRDRHRVPRAVPAPRGPHAAGPMVPLALFRDRVFSAANVLYALAYGALAVVFFFVTLLFQNVRAWSAMHHGALLDPAERALPLGRAVLRAHRHAPGHGVDERGPRLRHRGGGASFALSRLFDGSSSYGAVWPCYLFIGLGYGMLVPAVSSAAMLAVPGDHSGVGSGVLNSSRQVGAAVGLAVVGSLSVATVSRAWLAHLDALRKPRGGGPRHTCSRSRAARPRRSRRAGTLARSPRAVEAFVAGYRWRCASGGDARRRRGHRPRRAPRPAAGETTASCAKLSAIPHQLRPSPPPPPPPHTASPFHPRAKERRDGKPRRIDTAFTQAVESKAMPGIVAIAATDGAWSTRAPSASANRGRTRR